MISGVVVVAVAEKSSQQQELPSSLTYSKSTVVVNFDPKKGQLPEGLVINNKDIFVAWAPIGQVAKIDKNNFISAGKHLIPRVGLLKAGLGSSR